MVGCRIFAGGLVLVLGLFGALPEAHALRIADRRSPKNAERAQRARTDYIILHTTEGAPKGALTKLRKNGEAHYLVNRDGRVFRIVDKDRVAFHAGRSMWNGTADLDRVSVGIEVVGYHNKGHRPAQIAALRELVAQLRAIYDVPADRVLTHAQVAYGRPNRYHRYDHRGRKRCAMSLGQADMRKALGLGDGPARDPDVDAGRLRVADQTLFARLFPTVSLTARGRPSRRARAKPAPKVEVAEVARVQAVELAKAETVEVETVEVAKAEEVELPDVEAVEAKLQAVKAAAEPVKVAKAPAVEPKIAKVAPGPRARAASTHRGRGGLCTVNGRVSHAKTVAGPHFDAASTIYLLPDGRVRTGAQLAKKQASLLETLPEGTRVLQDKTFGGYVKATRAPSEICGSSWRSRETVYRFPDGKLVSGHDVNPARLPKATMVFCAS